MNATGLPFKGADMAEYIYLDIETVPTQDEDVKAKIAETVKPPASMSKAETIAKWELEQRPMAIAEAVSRTALDGGYGHVVCIGWAVGGDKVSAPIIGDVKAERDLISGVFDAIEKVRTRNGMTVIVGHNVAEFDIRFLWQRAFVLGVRLPPWFPRDPKPWSDTVNDTMAMWAGARERISLDRLCGYLGIPGKQGMTGADIGRVWASGDLPRIAAYCRADVEAVRDIHRRMLKATGVV